MIECANTDVQDLLPEFAADVLDASERVEVEVHLSACPACRVDLEVLRAVRQARPAPSAINVTAIVAALPGAVPAPRERSLRIVTSEMPAVAPSMRTTARTSKPARTVPRWIGASSMRMAAALMLVVVGGLSVSMARRGALADTERATPVLSEAEFVIAQSTVPYADGSDPIVAHVPLAPAVLPIQELSDYTDAELSLLLDRLDAWDGAPSLDVLDPLSTPTNDSLSEGDS